MNCSFMKKQEVVEVLVLCLEQNEFNGNYTLKVMGMDTDGNYTNSGELMLSESEMQELIANHYIDEPKQIVGKRIAVISNALCREAEIQHLNTILTVDEWQQLQPFIEKSKQPFAGLALDDVEELIIE